MSGQGHWLKLAEAARLLGVSEITLRRKIRNDKIPHEFRDGKYYVCIGMEPAAMKQPAFPSAKQAVSPSPTVPVTEGHGQHWNQELPEHLRNTKPSPALSGTTSSEREMRQLQLKVAQQDNVIKELRRTLEDQQTLISFLEETLNKIAEQQTSSAARAGLPR